MLTGDSGIEICACINNILDEQKLPGVFMPLKQWEAGPGKAIAALITTDPQSPEF